MPGCSETLQFSLPNHGDSILSKMNDLREEHRFCDITLILGRPQDSTVHPLQFQGHRVVLAASSDFLRDQFLLHKGRSELSVAVVSNVKVAKTLLLSCYTGFLEVPQRELVSYLTAASVLQMSQVVEKCVQAISQYLSPTTPFLNLTRLSEEKETQQLSSRWLGSSFDNPKERDAALPDAIIHKTNSKEVGTVVVNPRLTAGQEAKVDTIGLREPREAKIDLSQDAECCLDMLKLGKEGDALPCYTSNPLSHAPHTADVKDSPKEEKKYMPKANQLQQSGKLGNSSLFCHPKTPLSKIHFAADNSDTVVFQKPYLCRKCDKVFQHFESYVGHLKEHRQYFCLVCGKVFSQKNNLTHIGIHTGFKPFRCPLCHMTFTQKAMLQHHFNLHTWEENAVENATKSRMQLFKKQNRFFVCRNTKKAQDCQVARSQLDNNGAASLS
uniref:Zinc finger and BTB domain containing 26 n=1 Tax=Astatotilapia calliptera TaxID=8154 RepID=A0AAX7TMD3_ASTCA